MSVAIVVFRGTLDNGPLCARISVFAFFEPEVLEVPQAMSCSSRMSFEGWVIFPSGREIEKEFMGKRL